MFFERYTKDKDKDLQNDSWLVYILGLGTNLGARLENLRIAVNKLKTHPNIQVTQYSKIYLTKAITPENSPKSWDIDFFNMAIEITTTLQPLELLQITQCIEIEIGRAPDHEFWSPRLIDIDILACQNTVVDKPQLTIPHKLLLDRNFALGPLLEIYPEWLHPLHPRVDLQNHLNKMPLLVSLPYRLTGTQFMGIVNLTPESMSGKQTLKNEQAIWDHMTHLVNQGAEIIDIGAESTRPDATPLSSEEGWSRLEPFLNQLEIWLNSPQLLIQPKISIDTYHAETVKKLMGYPIDMINDVYGTEIESMLPYLIQGSLTYIFMHHCGAAGSKYLSDQISASEQVIQYGQTKMKELIEPGLSKEKLVYDIGIGFGKTTEQAQEIIQNIDEIKKAFDIPLLIGHSRKASALPKVAHIPPQERDEETAKLSRYFIDQGIDYLRVHQPNQMSNN